MGLKRLVALALCALLACLPVSLADQTPEEEIASLQAELAERDQRIAELEQEVAALRDRLGITWGPEDAAAEFDGGHVTVEAASAEYGYRAYYYRLFGIDPADYVDDLKMEVLRDLAEDAVLAYKAREFGVYELDDAARAELEKTAQAQLDELVDYYRAYRYQEGMTEEEVTQSTLEYLAGEGYTLAGIVESLTAQAWRGRLYDYVTADITMSEEELASYYNTLCMSQQMMFTTDYSEYEYTQAEGSPILWNPRSVRAVRYALVAFAPEDVAEYNALMARLEESADEENLAQIEALYASLTPRAEEICSRARAGESFLGLIDEYSRDGTFAAEPWRSRGMYVCEESSSFSAEFVEAAMALPAPGSISDPVRSGDGLLVLEYLADVPAGAVPMEDVREELEHAALEEKKDVRYNDTVEKWLEEANIRFYPERF